MSDTVNTVISLGKTHLLRYGVHVEEIDHFLDKLERYHYDLYAKIDREDIRKKLIDISRLTRTERIDIGGNK